MEISQQTKDTLGKYGVQQQQPSPSKVSNVQNQKNETVNEIKIVQPSIPVTKPVINVSSPEIAVDKYKKWLSQSFDRQNAESKKSIKDLRERDLSLTRMASSVFRKIEDLGHRITTGYSEESLNSALQTSFSPILMMFGLSVLPVIWKPLMETLASFDMGFRSFFGLGFEGTDLQQSNAKMTKGATFIRSIKRFLGTDDPQGKTSFIACVGKLALSGVEHLMNYLGIVVSERGEMIKSLENPGYDKWDAAAQYLKVGAAGVWNFLGGDANYTTEKTRDFLSYLGDVLGIALGGEWYVKKKLLKDQDKDKGKELKENGAGFHSQAKTLYKRYGVDIGLDVGRYIDSEGNFNGSSDPSTASLVLSNLAVSAINDTNKQNIGTTQFAIQNLSDLAEKTGWDKLPVTKEFMSLIPNVEKLKQSGDVSIMDVDYVYVKVGDEEIKRNQDVTNTKIQTNVSQDFTRTTEDLQKGTDTHRGMESDGSIKGDGKNYKYFWKVVPKGDPRYKDFKKKVSGNTFVVNKKAIDSILGDDVHSGKSYHKIKQMIENRYKAIKKVQEVPAGMASDISEKYQKIYTAMDNAQGKIDMLNAEDTEWNNFVNNVSVTFGNAAPNDITYGQTITLGNDQAITAQNRGRSFDIRKAIAAMYGPVTARNGLTINSPATNTQTHHKCAAFVRRFIEAGGLDTSNAPIPGGDYDSVLPTWGFMRIDNNTPPIPGDIAVMKGGGTGYGHIQMFDGHHWVSDFAANNEFPNGYYGQSLWRFPQTNDVAAKQQSMRSGDAAKLASKSSSTSSSGSSSGSSKKSNSSSVSSAKNGENKSTQMTTVYSAIDNVKFGNVTDGSGNITPVFKQALDNNQQQQATASIQGVSSPQSETPSYASTENISYDGGEDIILDIDSFNYVKEMAEVITPELIQYKSDFLQGFAAESQETQVVNNA